MAPATVRVPVMVWFAANVSCIKPAEDGAEILKLLNVFSPVIVGEDAVVLVKDTS